MLVVVVVGDVEMWISASNPHKMGKVDVDNYVDNMWITCGQNQSYPHRNFCNFVEKKFFL